MAESLINKANRYALEAEEHAETRNWGKAAYFYQSAADSYTSFVNQATEERLRRTIRVLRDSMARKAFEMSKKQEWNRMKNRESTLTMDQTTINKGDEQISRAQSSKEKEISHERKPLHDSSLRKNDNSTLETIEQEETLLEKEDFDTVIDPMDRFHRFWQSFERLVQKLPNPTTFTSRLYRNHGEEQVPDTLKMEMKADLLSKEPTAILGSFFLVSPDAQKMETRSMPPDHIPLENTKHLQTLEQENAALKAQNQLLIRKIMFLESAAEENNLLKNSIAHFRLDVEKQAEIILKYPSWGMHMSSSGLLSTRHGNNPKLDQKNEEFTSNHEIQRLKSYIKKLEEQLDITSKEKERHALTIQKYRDRWNWLREATKKNKMDHAPAAFISNKSSLLPQTKVYSGSQGTIDSQESLRSQSTPISLEDENMLSLFFKQIDESTNLERPKLQLISSASSPFDNDMPSFPEINLP